MALTPSPWPLRSLLHPLWWCWCGLVGKNICLQPAHLMVDHHHHHHHPRRRRRRYIIIIIIIIVIVIVILIIIIIILLLLLLLLLFKSSHSGFAYIGIPHWWTNFNHHVDDYCCQYFQVIRHGLPEKYLLVGCVSDPNAGWKRGLPSWPCLITWGYIQCWSRIIRFMSHCRSYGPW